MKYDGPVEVYCVFISPGGVGSEVIVIKNGIIIHVWLGDFLNPIPVIIRTSKKNHA